MKTEPLTDMETASISFILAVTQLEVVKNTSTIGNKKYIPNIFQRVTIAIAYHLLDNPKHLLYIFSHNAVTQWWKDLNAKPDSIQTGKSKAGRPSIPDTVKDYILQIKIDNPKYGYKRISGIMRSLGFPISPSSVCNIIRNHPDNPFTHGKSYWNKFLKDQKDKIIACDFIKIFRPKSNQYIHLLFFINHANRELLHFNTTEHPTREWIENQLRAFADNSKKTYLIRDNDMLFKYVDFAKFGLTDTTIQFMSPNMNAIAERVVLSYKQETDYYFKNEPEIDCNKIHSSFKDFKDYYNNFRPHQSINNITIPQYNKGYNPLPISFKELIWLDIAARIKVKQFHYGRIKAYYR